MDIAGFIEPMEDEGMDDRSVYCPQCMRQAPHVKARAGIIMCVICRHERPWNTTGWQ